MSHISSFGDGKSSKDENFDEDDVWGVDEDKHDDSSSKVWRSHESSGFSSAWRNRTDPKTNPNVIAATSHEGKLARGSSAPQDIPDWSKIYGVKNTKGSSSYAYSDGGSTTDDAEERCCHENNTDCDDNGYGDDDIVPPHEWIARKLARSQISSFSVCEGFGRTLKGRDLSKVRNAVLTKTGFIE